uniref:Uncharacterized protein n=1 Tax=Dulem virus 40 TaxID=3145758 RepID=A0AAU8AUQ7_9CAUD
MHYENYRLPLRCLSVKAIREAIQKLAAILRYLHSFQSQS